VFDRLLSEPEGLIVDLLREEAARQGIDGLEPEDLVAVIQACARASGRAPAAPAATPPAACEAVMGEGPGFWLAGRWHSAASARNALPTDSFMLPEIPPAARSLPVPVATETSTRNRPTVPSPETEAA
jgi:hypothetical protein